MIQANEIRAGNWVGMNVVGPVKISSIPEGSDTSDLYPIQLTDKILEEIGFERVSENVMSLNRFFCQYDNHAGYGLYLGNDFLSGVEYVHELQNAIFDATGEILDFDL